MGLLDLESVFDVLDRRKKGFLSIEEVQEFDETLHFTPLNGHQVREGIAYTCGRDFNGHITRDLFAKVVLEFERRRQQEEKLRWDFMALDQTGNNCLPVNEALTFVKLVHGDAFSAADWKKFVGARESSNSDVYWDEIKVYVCNVPDPSTASSTDDYNEEQQRLAKEEEDNVQEDFDSYMKNLDDSNARKNQEYKEKTRRLGKRKLDRWETEGIEGIIFDDGIDRGEHIPVSARDFVSLGDLVEALNRKYELLRKALFVDMLKEQFGEATWNAMSLNEQKEAFVTLQEEEEVMRKEGSLASKAIALYGAGVMHVRNLEGIMGSFGEELEDKMKNYVAMKEKLKEQGKNNIDADTILRQTFTDDFKVPTNTSALLVSLADRQSNESNLILSRMSSSSSAKFTSAQVMEEFCKLTHQHFLAVLEPSFASTASAIGLSERNQAFKQDRYNPDRERQEMLAQQRLELRQKTQVLIPWDDNDLPKVKGRGVVELQVDVIKELAWKHALERELLIELLQGEASEAAKSEGLRMSGDERNTQMSQLRTSRKQLKSSSSQFLRTQSKEHRHILQQGAGIYHAMRGEELALRSLDSFDAPTNIAVLADLQQKQDQERQQVLAYMNGKAEKDLCRLLRMQCAARIEEHMDNVAAVLLGTFESSEEEQPYLDALDVKFNALRALLISHQLKLEHGVGWHR